MTLESWLQIGATVVGVIITNAAMLFGIALRYENRITRIETKLDMLLPRKHSIDDSAEAFHSR